MDLTLKDIKLPKDPMATDQEDSDVSSMDEARQALQKRLKEMPKVDYAIPQNSANITGKMMFADQNMDFRVYDLERPPANDYSPTGNSWNQSDLESEYHRYDPNRYESPRKGIVEKNPQESESVSQAPTINVVDTNTVTDFSDLVNQRFQQDKAKKKASKSKLKVRSIVSAASSRKGSAHSNKLSPSKQGSAQSKRSLSSGKPKSKSKRNKKKSVMAGDDLSKVITKQELEEFNKKAQKIEKEQQAKSNRRLRSRKQTNQPSIQVSDAELTTQMKRDFSNRNKAKTMLMNEESQRSSTAALDTSAALRHHGTMDELTINNSPTYNSSPPTEKEGDALTIPWPKTSRNKDKGGKDQYRSATFHIQGSKKQLTNVRTPNHHVESQFSFKNQAPYAKSPSPLIPKPTPKEPPRQEESTPERILREFKQKAKAYKMGVPTVALKSTNKTAATDGNHLLRKIAEKTEKSAKVVDEGAKRAWRDLMKECKEEFELTTQDMYNPSPQVLYDAYLGNLGNTIGARLSEIAGRNMRVNLSQGKNFKKIQINVTTVHQTKFRLTKLGNGFGYGTTEKLSPEDAFLAEMFKSASPEVLKKRRLAGQRETLASLVPAIIKKAPKAVTDSLKALHLTCRRGVPIDKNGMPLLVEKDPYSRNKFLQYLQKNQYSTKNTQSTRGLRTNSLNHDSSLKMRLLLGDQEAMGSMAKISQADSEFTANSSIRRKVFSQQPIESKGREWIKKVDKLITKFDESFRQNEIQQQQIMETQKQLTAAKQELLSKIKNGGAKADQKAEMDGDQDGDQEGDGQEYESDGSHKLDSCSDEGEDEDDDDREGEMQEGQEMDDYQTTNDQDHQNHPPNNPIDQNPSQTHEMNRTFQTNEQREEYQTLLENLHEKYSNIESMASNALANPWDSRKEILHMAKPKISNSFARVSSLAASKSKFKRDRTFDNNILNERSGDLLGHNSSSKMLSPQQLFAHMEKLKIVNEAKKVRQPPSFKSTADKQVVQIRKDLSKRKVSLLELATTSNSKLKKLYDSGISKGESLINVGPGGRDQVMNNENPQIKYRPVPQQPLTERVTPNQRDMSPKPFGGTTFDINQAARQQSRNTSIMDQLTGQTTKKASPTTAKLPHKMQEKSKKKAVSSNNNRDIEAFIASSPKKKILSKNFPIKASPQMMSSSKGSSHKGGASTIHQSSPRRDTNALAMKTMVAFKKDNPEPLITNTTSKFPDKSQLNRESDIKPQNHENPESDRPTMHMTMTEFGKDSTTSPRDDIKRQTLPVVGEHHQAASKLMNSSVYSSEDMTIHRERANQSNGFERTQNMQIVDEADETESINRPSFFDAMKITVKTTKPSENQNKLSKFDHTNNANNAPQSHRNTMSNAKFAVTQSTIEHNASKTPKKLDGSSSLAAHAQMTLKALKEQQISSLKFPERKPRVPTYSLPPKSKMINGKASPKLGGFKTTRGNGDSSIKLVDLKPISHTKQAKFKPHPCSFERFRADLSLPQRKNDRSLQQQKTTNVNGQTMDSLSPYQMMLEAMKNSELVDEDGVARPTIHNLEDSIDFKGSQPTIENAAELRASYAAFEDRLQNMMQQTNSTAFQQVGLPRDQNNHDEMGQTMMTESMGLTSKKFNFGKSTRIDAGADKVQEPESPGEQQQKMKDSQYRRPYFKNDPPLKDTYISQMQKKFQATDLKFQRQAQRLVQDVRQFENQHKNNQQRNNNSSNMSKTVSGNLSHNTMSNNHQQSRTAINFNARNTSVNVFATADAQSLSLKQQLMALKMKEANEHHYATKGQTQSDWHKRRRSELPPSHHQHTSRPPPLNEASESKLPSEYEIPTIHTPMRSMRNNNHQQQQQQQFGETSQSVFAGGAFAGSYYDGGDNNPMNQTAVSYTFKKFLKDSQKEHTKHILPSVVKFQ